MSRPYKTPGVYVEEIPKLPPGVAQVETAIPAFIGYTEKAEDIAPNDLNKKPKRIASLVEFEHFYGAGPSPNVSIVNIDRNNIFVSASVTNRFYLYDSIRLFYFNGGGDCYIISVGLSAKGTTISLSDFTNGLTALEIEDEVTIILFPDAAALDDVDTGKLQQAALLQCNKLRDRVGIFDVKELDPVGVNFRNFIGINNLKYGAVYSPWLKVNMSKRFTYPDLKSVIKKMRRPKSLSSLTSDINIRAILTSIDQAYADRDNIEVRTRELSSHNGDLSGHFNNLLVIFNTAGGNTNTNLKNIYDYVYSIAELVGKLVNGSAGEVLTLPKFLANLTAGVTSDFDKAFKVVVSLNKELETDLTDNYIPTDFSRLINPGTWPLSCAATASSVIDQANDDNRRITSVNLLKPMFEVINTTYQNMVVKAAFTISEELDNLLSNTFPVYKAILDGVGTAITTMPPSGAVAGVYASVDRTRGVWKAPANVPLHNVIAPATVFSDSQLGSLNIDSIEGKSINAIRNFTGRGTLVFGARTLAGNDNEWRYISVRRFFNMVEESCKKSTEMFVFEPNDSNSWVKIQGMLENYLTNLWRQGALQGAKPEHAFYVAVGLGRTMTAIDILEGRMIVEIGMAVVRPSEFIVLRFSHKLAES